MTAALLANQLPPWAMERNLVLQAGAGSGKTHALVTLALHLLSGANARREPVPAARLVALTFTEKAGAELRERLQRRLTPLAEGKALADVEPDLGRTFEHLSLPTLKAVDWHRIRRDLALASVGTFHGFCAAQLRRFAPAAGLDPGFAVLDEDASRTLFEESVERHVFGALARRDDGVRALVDELGLNGNGRVPGLIDLTRSVLARVEEEGRDPGVLDDGRFDDAAAIARYARAATDLRLAIDALDRLDSKASAKYGEGIRSYRDVAANLSFDVAERNLERLEAIQSSFRLPTKEAGSLFKAVREAVGGLEEAWATVKTAPLGRAFVKLLVDIEHGYRDAKHARDAVDFADLQRLLRDLLRDDLATRRELKGRISALLVDEFQDTSRLQLDLVALLAEQRRAEATFTREDLATSVTWEPGLLCVVGDRKQSIYEFRGADVAVFGSLQDSLANAAEPARREHLRASRRSRPRLVALANQLFEASMTAATDPFQVAFTADDALDAHRPDSPGPVGELLLATGKDADEIRRDEAARLAQRIEQLFTDPDVRVFEPGTEAPRHVQGRDIAVLFRRTTNMDLYRAALAERGIAHVVVGGGGFYQSLEILDAWALLRVLDEPSDPIASAAVLRSPWCALSDPTLVRLSAGDKDGEPILRGIDLARLLKDAPTLADEHENARFQALSSFVRRHKPELDRLGPSRALGLALDELDYLAAIAQQPDADSIASNLTKLRSLLDGLSRRQSTARAVVRELTLRVRDGKREAEAASSEETDPTCVRLMSIHQSKGLEFPVVFVVDAGAPEVPRADRIEYDRDLGLALNVRKPDGKLAAAGAMPAIRERLSARSQAESLRLFYVAATRARDFLVISGGSRSGKPATPPKTWLDFAHALPPDVLPRRTVDVTPPTPPTPPTPVIEALAPTKRPHLPIRTLTATVTRLQDFELCAERYRLRHDIGLDEHPPARFSGDDDEADPSLDVFQRGTLAHRLLELADYEPLDDARLDALLRAEGHDPKRHEIKAIRDDVRAFLSTPTAQRLAKLRPNQRLKELPFFVSFDVGDGRRLGIKGQIDLVAITPDGADIVDYKHSRFVPDASERYRFQLRTYAVAVRELLAGAPLPLRVGLAFLRERGLDPSLETLPPEGLEAHVTALQHLGARLLDAHATSTWPREERSFCDRIECGYRRRCHPERDVDPDALDGEAPPPATPEPAAPPKKRQLAFGF